MQHRVLPILTRSRVSLFLACWLITDVCTRPALACTTAVASGRATVDGFY